MKTRKRDADIRMSKRYSVSFSHPQVDALEELSNRNAVSVSWLVRFAITEFIKRHGDSQLPLDFHGIGR